MAKTPDLDRIARRVAASAIGEITDERPKNTEEPRVVAFRRAQELAAASVFARFEMSPISPESYDLRDHAREYESMCRQFREPLSRHPRLRI